MATKAELEEDLAAATKKVASLEKRLAKAREKAKEPTTDDAVTAASNDLVDGILARGLDVQVGQKQLRVLCEALGRPYSRAEG